MDAVRWVGFVAGIGVVGWTALSLITSLIVPRMVRSRVIRALFRGAQTPIYLIAGRFERYETKDRILALEGPIQLIGLLAMWLVAFFLGYALLLWPLVHSSFGQALRRSGSSMFTLGFASSRDLPSTFVDFLAAASGLATVALIIAYLPALYSAFNRRETLVTMLESRAGAPAWGPEILARHQQNNLLSNLPDFYAQWETWAADVAESHTNYPILISLRSPDPFRSWIVGLLAVLDSAALYNALCPTTAPVQARLCLRMGFTALRDVARAVGIVHNPDPDPSDPIELAFDDFLSGLRRLERSGFPAERTPEEAWPHFKGWRVNYEKVAYALADRAVAVPGPWSGTRRRLPGFSVVPQRPPDRRPDAP
jgi:hypothetical protein